VDLYPFLIGGLMTAPDLREGDSIVVGQQKALVAVDGAVRNNYLFELPTPARGKALMALAHPLPAATHVSIRGSRDNRPFSQYIDLAAFTDFAVQDQDQITFVADARTPFIRVRVQGSRQAPSVLTVKDTTTLPELLATLQIDPDQADVSNVYILRRTVFEQQTRIMNDAMDRLERNLFLSSAPTANIAQIQSSEANLAATYLHRARQTTADGRLVVVDDQGRPANIRLEDEDIVVIPKRSQTVLVGGEVMTPQIVVYDPRLTRADYIARAGGLAEHGKGGRCIIRRASGLVTEKDAPIRPGDEIIVLPTIGHHNIQLSIDIVDIAYQMAVVANVLK
jgi:hypothetical protein